MNVWHTEEAHFLELLQNKLIDVCKEVFLINDCYT